MNERMTKRKKTKKAFKQISKEKINNNKITVAKENNILIFSMLHTRLQSL